MGSPQDNSKTPQSDGESASENRRQSQIVLDSSALSGLNERDIEMDNLKTIIVALNQKVKSRDDLHKQVSDLKAQLEASNKARD
jgi:hypothetical protein